MSIVHLGVGMRHENAFHAAWSVSILNGGYRQDAIE